MVNFLLTGTSRWLSDSRVRRRGRNDRGETDPGTWRRNRFDRRVIDRPWPRLAGETDALRHQGAARPPTAAQWTALGGALAVPAIALVLWPAVAGQALHHLFFLLFSAAALTRLVAAMTPRTSAPAPALDDAALPAYTVIAPLYREAEVAAQLLAALDAVDYPRDRLQVLIVVEADDRETRQALAALTLPRHVEILAAPPGRPRTKPRACNIALERATGEIVTIYDAEDRPHPLQLREAAARFAAGSTRLACLQAPLRLEPDRRFLPRQFAIEYAIQFETILPLLARLGLPFPLGGTSNHFRGIM